MVDDVHVRLSLVGVCNYAHVVPVSVNSIYILVQERVVSDLES